MRKTIVESRPTPVRMRLGVAFAALFFVSLLLMPERAANSATGPTGASGANAATSAKAATSGANAARRKKNAVARNKPTSADPRSFMHGVGVANAGDGKSWIFFSSSGLPPRGANRDGNWPHDVYVGEWSAGQPRMSKVHIFIQRPEAQEPVSIAQNTLGNIFVTFEDGWNTPNQVNQRYGVYRQDLTPLKAYPNDVASGGHSGHVAAVGERFVVFYSSDWVDGGGVDNLGTGGGVYVSTYDAKGNLTGQTDVAPKSREWWPMLAGSPDRALLVWQKFIAGSTSAMLEFAMFDPASGKLDKLGDLQPNIEYYVYAAGWVDAIKRFLVLSTNAHGKGVAVLIDELGNRTALLDDLPATVREANFGVSGNLAYVPARDGRLLTLALAPDSIALQAAKPAPVPWGNTGIVAFETAPGALHFVSLTPAGVREADVK
jgi:hypothetical protein